MQIARLFETVYILMQKGNVTAKQLSERLGVSERTVYRDLDILSGAGIPVYTTQGKGGGIRLLDGFVLDKSFLTQGEQREMLFALQSLKAARDADSESVLSRLGALFNQNGDSWVEIDFSNWGNFDRDRFLILKKAVLQKKVIAFDYYNSQGEKSARSAEPLQLWFKNRAWFLKAFCRSKQDYRIFKISRMKNIVPTDVSFVRDLSRTDYNLKNPETFKIITLKLRLDPQMAYRVYDEFEENAINVNEDGSYTVLVSYPEDEWVYGYILSFGSDAEVLEPACFREEIKNRLNRMIKKYL